jgi:hypothetical protein
LPRKLDSKFLFPFFSFVYYKTTPVSKSTERL